METRRSGVVVEFSDLCFHLYVSSDLGNLDQDEVLEYLFERTEQQENMQLERLAKVFSAFKQVALESGQTIIHANEKNINLSLISHFAVGRNSILSSDQRT